MLDKELRQIFSTIEKVTNFDASQYRFSTLMRRLNLRLSATHSSNHREYLMVLKKDPIECQRFIQTLTINVTDFFRDKEVFLYMKNNYFPQLIGHADKRKRRSLSTWSMGCSRGQEPYSLAILWHEFLGSKINDYKIMIQATDVDGEALSKARSGLYTPRETASLSKSFLRKYFFKQDGMFKIKPSLQKMIKFKQFDIIKDPPPGKFDMVLCRNVFIFFEAQLQKKLLEKLYASLKKEGILILGRAEMLHDEEHFQCLSGRFHIYKKKQPAGFPV